MVLKDSEPRPGIEKDMLRKENNTGGILHRRIPESFLNRTKAPSENGQKDRLLLTQEAKDRANQALDQLLEKYGTAILFDAESEGHGKQSLSDAIEEATRAEQIRLIAAALAEAGPAGLLKRRNLLGTTRSTSRRDSFIAPSDFSGKDKLTYLDPTHPPGNNYKSKLEKIEPDPSLLQKK